MNDTELTELKNDWLADNAAVALLGALLIGQSWPRLLEGSGNTLELLLLFEVPDYTATVLTVLILGLFCLSIFLAVTSVALCIRHLGLRLARYTSPILTLILLASFTLSWITSSSQLPNDQWWSSPLFLGGMGMFLFIGFRRVGTSLFRFLCRNTRRPTLTEPNVASQFDRTDNVEPDRTSRRMRVSARLPSISFLLQMVKSSGFWIATAAAVAVVEIALTVLYWDWLRDSEPGSVTLRNVGLMVAASLALVLAIWRALVADRQANTAREALLNERYQRAAEMLGSDVLSVRIGGVHAVHDLAKEHPEQYHVRIMRLLCAFARNPASVKADENDLATGRVYSDIPFLMLREDLQAMMDVIRGRSNAEVHLEEREGFRLQLQYADLRGATLHGADLRRAILWGADLSGAFLASTRLDCARLNDAKLFDTQFSNEGDNPATGLTQQQLDEASGDPEAGPKLTGVLDVETKQPLVWREKPTAGEALRK